MADYNVFVSHSMRPEDLGIIYEAARDAQLREINYYVAERDVRLGQSLPEKIENAIRNCDCFVVFLTHGGASSAFVNQEIGLARGCGKLRIQVVEKGVQVQGFDIDKEYMTLDRCNPAAAISALNDYLLKLKADKEAKQPVALPVVPLEAMDPEYFEAAMRMEHERKEKHRETEGETEYDLS